MTLRESLVREGPLEPLRATELARQVVLALGAAHDSGLVHRDIKPANVLLTPRGVAKLADFGLVRRLDELAQGGAPLAGTPTFMAPELFQGTPASPRSDIYALGVMLFYTLSGRLPFSADKISQLIQLHQHQPVPDVREIVARFPTCWWKSWSAAWPSRRPSGLTPLPSWRSRFSSRFTVCAIPERLVRDSADGLDCFIQGCRDTFRVILPQPGDRLQEVIIEATEGKNDERYLSVFSVCGPADPAYFEYALTPQRPPDLRQYLDTQRTRDSDVRDVSNLSARYSTYRGCS